MNLTLAQLPLLAAVALGVAGGFGVAALTVKESVPLAPAATMRAVTPRAPAPGPERPSPSQAVESQGGDVFGRIPAIVDRVQPAVVSVLVKTAEGGAEGSGVVFDGRRGLVVTNNHVVADAIAVEVVLVNGERLDARVEATDALTDLALLTVERAGLPEARFADELPRVGELAVALGNPLGFENSAAAGIVSGLHRVIPSGGRSPSLVDLIQTDAPISPGNSGGPLVDGRGRVVGINVAAIPPTQETRAASIGFAIPARTVVSVLQQLSETGQVRHAFLGIQPANLTPDVLERFDVVAEEGVLVVTVSKGGAAAHAGLRTGDVIVAFGREPIRIVDDLLGALRRYDVGDGIVLGVLRDGKRVSVPVTLAGQTGS